MDNISKARRKHSPAFKAKVALEALKERETLSQLGAKYSLNPVQITQWKKQLLDHSSDAFLSPSATAKADDKEVLIETLYKKIGQYQVELDWLKKKSGLQS
jgi:transposase-like protein